MKREKIEGRGLISVSVLNFNAAGAKILEKSRTERARSERQLADALERMTATDPPDFILLQEIARYGKAGSKPRDLVGKVRGYHYRASIAIDTMNHPHPDKWDKYRTLATGWEPGDYLGQGYGILWREDIAHCPVWDLVRVTRSGEGADTLSSDIPTCGPALEVEIVHLDTGFYTGDRDTEPRLAVIAHFVVFTEDHSPVDVFIVNLHLTTLKGEREGLPERDELGSRLRNAQLDIVLHGIVSRYNQWRQKKLGKESKNRLPAVWILSGDFNATPSSPEVLRLERANFMDMNPHKGAGTKAAGIGETATLTVDYIFAGPKYVALDPFISEQYREAADKPLDKVRISDHYPIRAQIPICVPAHARWKVVSA